MDIVEYILASCFCLAMDIILVYGFVCNIISSINVIVFKGVVCVINLGYFLGVGFVIGCGYIYRRADYVLVY